jgi:hypothetical protein
MPVDQMAGRAVDRTEELAAVSGVAPAAAALRVLHVHGRAQAAQADRMAEHERALGWQVALHPVDLGTELRRTGADVVVLHGRRAGAVGRLALRGRRATVLVPAPGAWAAGPLSVVWERIAARWTSAVVVGDPAEAERGVRRKVWTPPFVVGDSLQVSAAVLTRAHAYGRPGPRLAEALR